MRTLNKITGVFALVFAMLFSTNVMAQDSDIVELAVDTEQLSTLVTAVQAADLVETLQSEGPFTVFAPTNEAFEALPEGVLDMLLKPENKEMLVSVLTYHVVSGKVMSGDLEDGMKAATVEGSEATIKIGYGNVMVDNATFAAADIEASNGVVHVIDAVILPPSIKEALASNGEEESTDEDW
ncbi:fasciclin domain-containing protein [Gracilimonas sp.]|uniref:fasciclin domain-containing protein n=1 Tax=Gracilimonas sp. TaxID=1974203 RepID=UPI00287183D8|nr:fasciclin domain-containing protein [Gracilimonas sp.]